MQIWLVWIFIRTLILGLGPIVYLGVALPTIDSWCELVMKICITWVAAWIAIQWGGHSIAAWKREHWKRFEARHGVSDN